MYKKLTIWSLKIVVFVYQVFAPKNVIGHWFITSSFNLALSLTKLLDSESRSIVLANFIYIIYIVLVVTVLRIGQLKYKVNKRDHNPPHVHVEGGGATIRVNLLTLEIMDDSTDFSKTMVRKIVTYIAEHKEELLEKWVEYHEED